MARVNTFRDGAIINLPYVRYSELPPGSAVALSHDPITGGFRADIASLNATFHLKSWDQAQAMTELIDKLDEMLAKRRTAPMRADRHDRGWPKVAA